MSGAAPAPLAHAALHHGRALCPPPWALSLAPRPRACPCCHQALPGGHLEAGLAQATVEPPDLAVGMLLALGVWWGCVRGQAGTACQLLHCGAGRRDVLRCCAGPGQAGSIPPAISVLYPTLPFLRMRNPWVAVRDLRLAVPRLFHSSSSQHLANASGTILRGAAKASHRQGSTCMLLRYPASVCSLLRCFPPYPATSSGKRQPHRLPHTSVGSQSLFVAVPSAGCAPRAAPQQVPAPQRAAGEQELVSCPSAEASQNCKRHPIFWKLNSDNK